MQSMLFGYSTQKKISFFYRNNSKIVKQKVHSVTDEKRQELLAKIFLRIKNSFKTLELINKILLVKNVTHSAVQFWIYLIIFSSFSLKETTRFL